MNVTRRFGHILVSALPLLFLTACGGGSGDSAPASTSGAEITLSGTATYTGYPLLVSGGIDYSSPQNKPIRGAVIELWDQNNNVLARNNTSATGGYSFAAPAQSAVKIIIKAALGTPTSPDTYIRDNTSSDALYTLIGQLNTASSNITQNLNASSGWNGSSYSTTRSAAPFAILDTIYQAQQLIKSVDGNVNFPALNVYWSENNKPSTSTNYSTGDIGTSHFWGGDLYILGAANNDTDEYDHHVIAHEWTHYFENALSRTDSIGGDHGSDDLLDPTVAFSEGFSDAMSAIIMGNVNYIDTVGTQQSQTGLYQNIEADKTSDASTEPNGRFYDGYYSENSVQEVIYDLYDSNDDDETLALGFQPIYETLVNGVANSPALTTMFTFLHHLKQNASAYSTEITTLAAAENIATGNEYDGVGQRFYTSITNSIPVTQDINGNTLQTYDTFGPGILGDFRNKLLNRQFFKFTAPASGCYSVNALPANGSSDVIIYTPGVIYVDTWGFAIPEKYSRNFSANETWSFAIGSYYYNATFQVSVSADPGAC